MYLNNVSKGPMEITQLGGHTYQSGECIKGIQLCPLILDNLIAHSSLLARREAVLAMGGYYPDIPMLTTGTYGSEWQTQV
ncbi:hypothetical protein N9850_12975 [Granulosicoccus sp.]|nr:hypothetical protein [Granulosicoccus sp.]MDB4224679.1 hypothetical protein [Granulosicoccus sp.]